MKLSICLLFAFLFASAGWAQTDGHSAVRPKVGLVLSGGGAKGIAHVGVIKVLEAEGIPIDFIAGTSMGAIIGGLYAAGYTAQELEGIVSDQDWAPLFSDTILRREQRFEQRIAGEGVLIALPIKGRRLRLPNGLVAGQEAMMLLSRLTWDYHDFEDLRRLPIPFVAVATNLRTGQATALSDVSLSTAIRASMSLPSIFAPVAIGDELFVDGGISRNLPASDARDLGADVLIGVDVADLPEDIEFDTASLVDVLVHGLWYQAYTSDVEQRPLLDVLLRPDIGSISATGFDQVGALIAAGEASARAVLPTIRTLTESTKHPDLPLPDFSRVRLPRQVSGVEIVGVEGEAVRLVNQRLGLTAPANLGPDDIEEAVSRVYGTGLFELVTYRLLPDGADAFVLAVNVVPYATADRLGVGVRYDSHFGTQILATLSLRNRLLYGSTADIRFRVGDQYDLSGSFFAQLGRATGVNFGARIGFAGAPIRLFLPDAYARAIGGDPDVPVLGLRMEVVSASLFGGYKLSESAFTGFRLQTEFVTVRREVAGTVPSPTDGPPVPEIVPDGDHGVVTFGAFLRADSFDRRSFPSSGSRVLIDVRGGWSGSEPLAETGAIGDDPWIRTARISAEKVESVTPRIAVFATGMLSLGSGRALPLSYFSFLGGVFPTTVLPGGFVPLLGTATQERFGRKAWMGLAGIQWQIGSDMYVRTMVNVGDTWDILGDDEDRTLPDSITDLLSAKPAFGAGIELGTRTIVGPARLLLSGGGLDSVPELSFSLGYQF